MSIVNWFSNKLSTEERNLTRDLLSVAVADKEFDDNERATLLDICRREGISNTQVMDSLRDSKVGAKVLHTDAEKKRYLLHLITMMSADERCSSLELHIIEIIARNLGIAPLQLLSFILDEVKEERLDKDHGIAILDNFVKHLMVVAQ